MSELLRHHTNAAQSGATIIRLAKQSEWDPLYNSLTEAQQNWLTAQDITGVPGECILCPACGDAPQQAIACIADETDMWALGALPDELPAGEYYLDYPIDDPALLAGWVMEQYRFTRYKEDEPAKERILLHAQEEVIDNALTIARAAALGRDLINLPTNDMGPSHLADAALTVAKAHKASCDIIVGDDLLTENYPLVHAVGRAAENKPRLIDIRWGDEAHPKLTLVGKGVCFDTGGLDIKSYSSMKMMKKDMGGAALMLSLAQLIMARNLPVRLRVLIPAVENSIADNAFRPQDVIAARNGKTVEIGSTDAEGRLILADALVEAASESPDLVLDAATLTGAARVALGTELPALFATDDQLARELTTLACHIKDPLWQLPLWEDYESYIKPDIADLANSPRTSYGGAITAALFLREFVGNDTPWMHIDTMAWNLRTRPGRPKGGEAMGLHSLFAWLEKRYTA